MLMNIISNESFSGFPGKGVFRIRIYVRWLMLIVFTLGLALPASAGPTVFQAKMVASVGEQTSTARIMAGAGKLRMKVMNGRFFSTMIADYGRDVLWLMAPSAKQYLEQPATAMGRLIPQFFHPGITVKKTRVAEETVAGRKAIKFEAQIVMPGTKRPYDGFLWEAEELPGYPLKWEDPEYRVSVEWLEGEVVPLNAALFELPRDYSEIDQPAPTSTVREPDQAVIKMADTTEPVK